MDMVAALAPTPTAAAPSAAQSAAARKAAENFEAFFLQQSFESMFKGLGTDTLFGGGAGEKIYQTLLLQQYSKLAARSSGIGVAAAVEREILRAQEMK
jgi:flagellar protein FlgJ